MCRIMQGIHSMIDAVHFKCSGQRFEIGLHLSQLSTGPERLENWDGNGCQNSNDGNHMSNSIRVNPDFLNMVFPPQMNSSNR